MTNTKKVNTDSVSLRDTALAFTDQRVSTMTRKIEESFARRDTFEASNGNAIVKGANGYTKARDAMLAASVAVSRTFLALGVEPDAVIERQVVSSAMLNVYAIDKITQLSRMVASVGGSSKVQAVTKAFLLCAIEATRHGATVITNDVNQRFLNSYDVSNLDDAKLIEYIENNRHGAMSTGAATQSSQMRNVIDVLGIGEVKTVHKSRDAVSLNLGSEFYSFIETALVA